MLTVQVRFPRIVHSELMTHRALNKNAGSSRAKPIKKMLAQVFREPACPVEWGAAQAGMQAHTQLTGWRLFGVKALWKSAAMFAAAHSWAMMKLGAAKQIANRVTEPYQYIDVLISGTEWDNFDMLRCHPDADPTMQALAIEIMTAIELSVPKLLRFGQWHLPYVTAEERRTLPLHDQKIISAARCARISYDPFDGNPSVEKERERFAKLVGQQPIHASPTEHQATPAMTSVRSGNLVGWLQLRGDIEKELKNLPMPPRLRRSLTADEIGTLVNRKLTDAEKDGLRVQLDFDQHKKPYKRVFKDQGITLPADELEVSTHE
jgi:hypothetical protein